MLGYIPDILKWILLTVFCHISMAGSIPDDTHSSTAAEYPPRLGMADILSLCNNRPGKGSAAV